MTWVKLDDQFPDHPKIEAAGPLAAWLYVCGLCYCAEHLTDGLIPASKAVRLAPVHGKHIDRLVEVGLWTRVPDGYRIHDYLDFQPSGEQVRRERKEAAERMANRRRSSPEVRPNTNGSSASPSPSPDVPNGTSASRPAKRGSRLPDDFIVTVAMAQWARREAPNIVVTRETERFCDYWRGCGKTKQDWVATWRNWMRKASDDAGPRRVRQSVGDRNIALLRGELA